MVYIFSLEFVVVYFKIGVWDTEFSIFVRRSIDKCGDAGIVMVFTLPCLSMLGGQGLTGECDGCSINPVSIH